MRIKRFRKGFTLIEMIIYIGLSSIIVVALLRVMLALTSTREKAETISIVQQEGRYTMHRIVLSVESALSIDEGVSVFNADNGSLVLEMSDIAENPTTISIVDNNVSIQKGVASGQPITSSGVLVDKLRFTNLSAVDTTGTVKIELHLTDNRAGDTSDYTDEITLTTSASLRQ